MMRGPCGLVALLLMAPSAARALPPDPEALPVYVSDQFKAVAERALRQLAHAGIARACPPEKPLCPAVAEALADALDDALAHRPGALRGDLSRFFAEATVRGAMAHALGDALDPSVIGPVARGMAPLVNCVAGTVTGRRQADVCAFGDRDATAINTLLDAVQCDDDEGCKELRAAVNGHQVADPTRTLGALAWIVQSDAIDRGHLRVFLKKAQVLIEVGLGDGLGPAAYAYLQEDTVPYGVRAIIDGDDRNEIWRDRLDAGARAVVGARGDAADRLAAWIAAREKGWFQETRAHLIRGEPVDLHPLTRLAGIEAPESKAGDDLQRLLRTARVLRAQLEMDQLMRVYGAVLVAATGVVDYVRDQDDAGLRRNMARAVLYAAAQLAARRHDAALLAVEQASGQPLSTGDLVTPAEALDSCELRAIAAELGLPREKATRCLSVLQHRLQPVVERLAAVEPVFTKAWRQHAENVLLDLKPLLEPTPASKQAERLVAAAGWLADRAVRPADLRKPEPRRRLLEALESMDQVSRRLDATRLEQLAAAEVPSSSDRVTSGISELLQVLQLFQRGSDTNGRRLFLRAGVDGLMARLDDALKDLVGGDGATCGERLRSSSIFCRGEAACVAHVLIASAYQPIADFFWQGGDAATGAPALARNVYTSLLKSPSLDSLPLILNVGLGANYITGKPFRSEQFWGQGGYGALTVIDKLGVAFYQYRSPETKFEAGLFAGGFLDALVRTAANAGKEERFWLLGLTAGFPRLAGMDVGLELHTAAAMPFQLHRGGHYGLAVGAAVVVPFSLVFEKEP